MYRTAIVLVLTLLVGCGSTTPRPPDSYYRVYVTEQPVRAASSRMDGVLVVERFASDGLVGERQLIYGDDEPNPLQQYHYHHWTESPTRLLQEALVPYLRGANVATEVVTPEVQVEAGYELHGKIRRMEQIRGEQTKVVVELEFVLSQPRAGKLLLVESYAAEVSCADDSLVAAVDAYNQAVSQIFSNLVADINRI